MTDILIPLLIVIWVMSGIFAYGACFAYAQRKWPQFSIRDYRMDMLMSGLLIPCGILGLIFIYLISENFHYGLKFR